MTMDNDTAITPRIQNALADLRQELLRSGYDTLEAEAITQGAREHVEELAAQNPASSEEELISAIGGFAEPEIAPSSENVGTRMGLIGNFALASGALGILITIGAFFSSDPDLGGALMLLGAVMGGGLACVLGLLSSRTQSGLIGLAMGAILLLSLLVFVAMA